MSSQYESFGKYVLLEKLATGGMAEVFLARGTGAGGIGKFFAVKRILPQYADSPDFIEMFKDEAKIAINLAHSNIVSIHEFGVERGQFFLVMDYVEGRNLRQILNKMKKTSLQFSIDQIVYIIKEVAGGLDHAHRCIDGTTGKPLNITHRDMSPQNIMVSFEGEVKIVDFGIAKAESQIETTRAGTLKGKFGYMSPEQAEGQPVDLRTDIFSLGIVIWELLANDRLFVANNEINTLRKIRDCQIPSLRKINPNIQTELERIILKALARDRNLRYQTGAALQRDLNRFLNRQYPDFNSQDFAVFIKSVFADEILSLRKRLVEYSKVNLALTVPIRNEADRTSVMDTNTDSMITTDSRESEISTDSAGPITAPSIGVMSEISNPSKYENPVTESQPSGADLNSGTESVPNPPPMFDESALASAMETPPSAQVTKIQPIDLRPDADSSPNIASLADQSETPAPPPTIVERRPREKESKERRTRRAASHPPARVATIMVFALLCLSGYSYLAKYFTSTMAPIIAATDPLLHSLHAALGVEVTDGEVARDIARAEENPQVNQAPPKPAEEPLDLNASMGLVVTSNPSGAEIILNDLNTGTVTPSRVQVPAHQAFSLVLRKRGYADFSRRNITRSTVGHRLDANLQKLTFASLTVEVFPPQEAVLFVNGKSVRLIRGVARDISVPGGQAIKVRAESPNGSYDEITVTVPVDRKRTVQVNPRKNSGRLPTNTLKN